MNNEISPSTIFTFKDSVDYSENAIVSRTLIRNEAATITLFAFNKNEALSEHTAPYDALVNILDGAAEIIIDRKSYMLHSGQSIIMPANVPHALKAIEAFKMLLIMIKAK